MENDQKPRVSINSEFLKKALLTQIRKLVLSYQVENQCSRDKAADSVAYFLKQVIFLLTKEE